MIDIESVGDVDVVRLAHGKVNALDLELLSALGDVLDRGRCLRLGGGHHGQRPGVLRGGRPAACARRGTGLRGRADPCIASRIQGRVHLSAADRGGDRRGCDRGRCIIAAACDRRLTTDGPAPIGTTELVVGVPFPVAPIEIMHHAYGHLAGDLVLRAEPLSVGEAVAAGLVDRAVPAGTLLDEAITAAARLASLPAQAYALAKRRLRAPAVERIERDAPSGDAVAAELWGAPETAARIADQLARLASARP
jgi:enoyl-CoA hydratase